MDYIWCQVVALSKLWHCWFPEVNWIYTEELNSKELEPDILVFNTEFILFFKHFDLDKLFTF